LDEITGVGVTGAQELIAEGRVLVNGAPADTFLNVLRRGVKRQQLLGVCLREWKRCAPLSTRASRGRDEKMPLAA